MFTGIVEEVGEILSLKDLGNGMRIEVESSKVANLLGIGDSVAVDGCCLTIVEKSNNSFKADLLHETVKLTSLDQKGKRVNLEPPLTLNKGIGGHLVSGHIDGKGHIVNIRQEKDLILTIEPPKELLRYVIHKGSITIDGVSLTVAGLTDESLTVVIIPHTAAVTTLGRKKVNDFVNIEVDIVGKYLEKLWKRP